MYRQKYFEHLKIHISTTGTLSSLGGGHNKSPGEEQLPAGGLGGAVSPSLESWAKPLEADSIYFTICQDSSNLAI